MPLFDGTTDEVLAQNALATLYKQSFVDLSNQCPITRWFRSNSSQIFILYPFFVTEQFKYILQASYNTGILTFHWQTNGINKMSIVRISV